MEYNYATVNCELTANAMISYMCWYHGKKCYSIQESGRLFQTQNGCRPASTMAPTAAGNIKNRKRLLRFVKVTEAASSGVIVGAGPLGSGGSK